MLRKRSSIAAVLMICMLTGCASKPPVLQPPMQYARVGMVAAFTSEDWQLVLGKVVTPGGYVRWDLLQKDATLRDALSRYVSLVGAVSPDNRPSLFQTKNDQLAYWINASNAVCMYGVLLRNLTDPPALHSIDRFLFGGVALTLDQVETEKIRPLNDPRVVFALNRCTHSSPPLRNEPYDGLKLSAQLIDQGKTFLSDSRGVRRAGDAIAINRLLVVNYGPDFLAAYQRKYGRTGTLLQAIEPYAVKHSALAEAKNFVPMPYDSSLNRP